MIRRFRVADPLHVVRHVGELASASRPERARETPIRAFQSPRAPPSPGSPSGFLDGWFLSPSLPLSARGTCTRTVARSAFLPPGAESGLSISTLYLIGRPWHPATAGERGRAAWWPRTTRWLADNLRPGRATGWRWRAESGARVPGRVFRYEVVDDSRGGDAELGARGPWESVPAGPSGAGTVASKGQVREDASERAGVQGQARGPGRRRTSRCPTGGDHHAVSTFRDLVAGAGGRVLGRPAGVRTERGRVGAAAHPGGPARPAGGLAEQRGHASRAAAGAGRPVAPDPGGSRDADGARRPDLPERTQRFPPRPRARSARRCRTSRPTSRGRPAARSGWST